VIWDEDETLINSPNLQLAFFEPDTDDEALMEAIAALLVERGATTRPHRRGGPELEVLGATGAVPPWMAEVIESGRYALAEEPQRPGGLVELVSDGEVLIQRSEELPELCVEIGAKLRDTFWWLLAELRPLYGVIAINQATWDLLHLEDSDDLALFAIGWVNLARVGEEAAERLRRALEPIETSEVAGGIYWSVWPELAAEGAAPPPPPSDIDIAHLVLEALTGRSIPAEVPPTEEEIDAMWWTKPPVDRPTVWVWDVGLDETALLAGVAAFSGNRDVELASGFDGWRAASIDLLGEEDDRALDILLAMAEHLAPSWISLSGALGIDVPGRDEVQLEGFAMRHIWINRTWLGEEALELVDQHLEGAYRAEHAGGVYFSCDDRYNPSGQVPAWGDDEAFDRWCAAAAVLAEVARRDRGIDATTPMPAWNHAPRR